MERLIAEAVNNSKNKEILVVYILSVLGIAACTVLIVMLVKKIIKRFK